MDQIVEVDLDFRSAWDDITTGSRAGPPPLVTSNHHSGL